MHLINVPSFKINEYLVPEFSIEKGKMLRFWVEIIPKNNSDTDGYLVQKLIQKQIVNNFTKHKELKMFSCPDKIKVGFFDFLNPMSVDDYLKNKIDLDETKVAQILSFFTIKPHYIIRKMGYKDQKIFSIISSIESNDVVLLDFYGFSPQNEKALTNYLLAKLKEGKALITFDNLYFKEKGSKNIFIEDINII
ncbi:hypothetical protein, partial [Winogradskyella sp.]